VASAYDAALAELYQAPLPQFIAERKLLAAELMAKKEAGATTLASKPKPPVSAWVVNQLWWHARDAFDDLMKSADKLRKGQLSASGEHRDAIAKLRKRAVSILEDANHNANEATLRRITTTLAAIAAAGGFEPDAPGTLAEDRDPPGFEAVGIPSEPVPHVEKPKHTDKDELAEAREQKRLAEEEKKRKAAEKHRLEAALRDAKVELHERERDVKAAEKELRAATDKMERAQEKVDELQSAIDEL
jgi:DNA repair exonuclease SbcCD ATPase subunit